MTEKRLHGEGSPDAEASAGVNRWPPEVWPTLFRLFLEGDQHVIMLDESWCLLQVNDLFRKQVLVDDRRSERDFFQLMSSHSALELRRLAEREDPSQFEVEIEQRSGDRFVPVEYVFRKSADVWIGVGRDRSAQLELVNKMSDLVRELETKIHREKERSEDLRALAEKDALTGLPNRRYFARVYGECQRRFETEGRAFSIFCVDVDRFKRVNDEHGHPAGDRVLQEVATILRSSTREGDLASRLGGDEFAVVASGIDGHGSVEMAERLRQSVESHSWPPPAERVTVSVGIASTREGEPQRSKRLLELADGALYRAKTCGRNRVEMAD